MKIIQNKIYLNSLYPLWLKICTYCSFCTQFILLSFAFFLVNIILTGSDIIHNSSFLIRNCSISVPEMFTHTFFPLRRIVHACDLQNPHQLLSIFRIYSRIFLIFLIFYQFFQRITHLLPEISQQIPNFETKNKSRSVNFQTFFHPRRPFFRPVK